MLEFNGPRSVGGGLLIFLFIEFIIMDIVSVVGNIIIVTVIIIPSCSLAIIRPSPSIRN